MKSRAEAIQARFGYARDVAMDALVELIGDLAEARKAGKSDADLALARDLQRKAQFYVDYVEAENSMGFHASGEALRVLTDAVDYARKGQLALRGVKPLMRRPASPEQRQQPAERRMPAD
jgi:nitrite reductase (cytochrome c-552)